MFAFAKDTPDPFFDSLIDNKTKKASGSSPASSSGGVRTLSDLSKEDPSKRQQYYAGGESRSVTLSLFPLFPEGDRINRLIKHIPAVASPSRIHAMSTALFQTISRKPKSLIIVFSLSLSISISTNLKPKGKGHNPHMKRPKRVLSRERDSPWAIPLV